jgi:hypothetical protein
LSTRRLFLMKGEFFNFIFWFYCWFLDRQLSTSMTKVYFPKLFFYFYSFFCDDPKLSANTSPIGLWLLFFPKDIKFITALKTNSLSLYNILKIRSSPYFGTICLTSSMRMMPYINLIDTFMSRSNKYLEDFIKQKRVFF